MEKGREDCIQIFLAGVDAVNPVKVIDRFVQLDGNWLTVKDKRYYLQEVDNIYVIGAGKASALMASAIEMILGDRKIEGCVNVKYEYTTPLKQVKLHEAGHPFSDAAGITGTQNILSTAQKAGSNDLVFCLISGGGSALLMLPAEGLTLKEIYDTTQILFHCGATIHELNAIRKHISQATGGRLTRATSPAHLITLILSDVTGDALDTIASGPTVPDTSTYRDCLNIFKRYGIEEKIPQSVLNVIQRGMSGEIEETPKFGDPIFQNTYNVIIGNNLLALEGARDEAERLGYKTLILSSLIEGETRDIAKFHAAIAKETVTSSYPIPKPACIISGGETTVTIKGSGKGGRNMEFVLASAIEIENLEGVTMLSGGTDGNDGPTDAAGALADGKTVQNALNKKLDPKIYLENNDSYHFFKQIGDLLITGPTNTNVMDIRVMLVR